MFVGASARTRVTGRFPAGGDALRRTNGLLATVLLAAVLAAAGCDHGNQPADPVIDIAQLDVGPYRPDPRDMGLPKNMDQARIYEAERLANVLPLPFDIDPAFDYTGPFNTYAFENPEYSLLKDVVTVDDYAQDAPDLIGGFATRGSNDPHDNGTELVNAVLIFPDEQKASDAAAALERADFAAGPDKVAKILDPSAAAKPKQPVSIPKYPGAHAHWEPTKQAISNWYATGKFVIITSVYDHVKIWLEKTDLSALVVMVTKSLDKFAPAVATFTPVPADTLMSQPVDDEGMLGRTLLRPKAAQDDWQNPPGVYNAHAALNFSSDSLDDRKWFDTDGVDKFAEYGTRLYRARNTAAATDVRDQLGDPEKHFKRADPPKNLPVAKCREYKGNQITAVRFYCAVSYGRYAAMSWAGQLLDAQQRIAAQYAILVKAT
jgi:hypothetical protein